MKKITYVTTFIFVILMFVWLFSIHDVSAISSSVFSNPIKIETTPNFFYTLQGVASGDNVYFVGETVPTNPASGSKINYFLAKSIDGGNSFSISPLDVNIISSAIVPPSIAVSRNTIYLAWDNETYYGRQILLQKSIDGGNTFSEPIIIKDRFDQLATLDQFVVNDNFVYLIWHDINGSYVMRSVDGGNSFNDPVEIGHGMHATRDVIIPSGNDLYDVWGNGVAGNLAYFIAKSVDGGNTFNAPISLNSILGSDAFFVGASASNNILYLNWLSEPVPNSNYYYKVWIAKSVDGGNTFSTVHSITTAGIDGGGQILSSGDSVYLFLPELAGACFTTSIDGGNTFSDPICQESLLPNMQPLSIFVANDRDLFIAGTSFNNNTNNYELYIAKSTGIQSSNIVIPSWIKNNAKWWSQGQIGDSDFVKGIQYLVSNGIMTIPSAQQGSSTSGSQQIPSWIKNNAGWWADGQISDSEFVKGIQYLVSNGIIQVS